MKMKEMKTKIDDAVMSAKKNIKTILMDFAVAFVSVVYVLYQVLVLTPTELNPITLITKGLIGIVVGIMIKQALGENGFTKGYKADTYLTAKKKYSKRCEPALPYIDKQEEYEDIIRSEKLARNRKLRLAGYRMKYEDFFDDKGNYIEHEIMDANYYKKRKKKYPDFQLNENTIVLDKRQQACLEKCVALKIYIKNMFSEWQDNVYEDEEKEKTDKQQKAQKFRSNLIGAIIVVLLGVYFTPEFVNWNWGAVILSLFQVFCWIAFGIVQLYDNYEFIVVYKVNLLEEKGIMIIKFLKHYITDEKAFKEAITIKEEKVAQESEKEQNKEQQVEYVEMTQEEFEKMKGTK